LCDRPVSYGAHVCPNCKSDLFPLAVLDSLGANLYRSGLELAREGQVPQAIEALQSATAYAPHQSQAWTLLGKLHAQAGRYPEALQAWDRARQFMPEDGQLTDLEAAARQQITRQQTRRTSLLLLPVVLVLILGGTAGFLIGRGNAATTPPVAAAQTQLPATQSEQVALATAFPQATPTPDLVEAAMAALTQDSQIASFGLQVSQLGNTVVLSGTVETAAQKALAEEMLLSQGQVAAVDSHAVAIVPPELAAGIVEILQSEPLLASESISVTQSSGGILLSGLVSSAAIKSLAEKLAGENPQVAFVDSRGLSIAVPPDYAQIASQALAADPRTQSLDLAIEPAEGGVRLIGKAPQPSLIETIGQVVRAAVGGALVDTAGLEVVWEGQTYTVTTEDSLSTIAQKFYKVWWMWPLIYAANRDVIDNPNRLTVGSELLIPSNIPLLPDLEPRPCPTG
jgi:nucleoid-associated protein YgaU